MALASPSNMAVAATEFVWRVYELSLELDEDPDLVLAELISASERVGDMSLLFAECFVNRRGAVQSLPGIAIDSPVALALLGELAPSPAEETAALDLSEVLAEQTDLTP